MWHSWSLYSTSCQNTVLVEPYTSRARQFCMFVRWAFALPLCVLFRHVKHSWVRVTPRTPPGVSRVHPARPGTGLFLGPSLGRLSSGSTNTALGHIRTHTGRRAFQGLCHVPNEQMFIPQHFSSWGLANALKKKKNFVLIIPFCCLCLFCFALFFFPYIKNSSCEEILPSCFLEQALP